MLCVKETTLHLLMIQSKSGFFQTAAPKETQKNKYFLKLSELAFIKIASIKIMSST